MQQDKHIKEKLSAYLNQELPKDERQALAEHLLQCEKCRDEHDRIKLGAALASHLKRSDAPENLWSEIENALDEKPQRQTASKIPAFPFFSPRGLPVAAVAALLIVFGLITAAVYFGLRKSEPAGIARNEPAFSRTADVETPPGEAAPNQNIDAQILSNSGSNIISPPGANPNIQEQPKNASPGSVEILPKAVPNRGVVNPPDALIGGNNLPAWNVEAIAGMPKAGNEAIAEKGKLAVGQFLETDANSRARVQVSNIGQVEVAPNSRLRLVKTQSTEHRLSLERGLMQAKIFAPPRLFIVDTPSAVAVDLGCEYTLEVDAAGNSRLHVTSGFVALERGGRESIVPAGAICFTRRGKGLGTPFSDDASLEFQKAVQRFDFENGGSNALRVIIREASLYDSLTLWHLLPRVPENEREKVFDSLAKYVKPPAGVTREGVLRLDKKMLDRWWTEIENVWFE
ncbi:MAG: FecR domain-containing protein [Acidobacteriota bacterium]|nr:FecR domain-containing protein [Acidobacteriota bacterium]